MMKRESLFIITMFSSTAIPTCLHHSFVFIVIECCLFIFVICLPFTIPPTHSSSSPFCDGTFLSSLPPHTHNPPPTLSFCSCSIVIFCFNHKYLTIIENPNPGEKTHVCNLQRSDVNPTPTPSPNSPWPWTVPSLIPDRSRSQTCLWRWSSSPKQFHLLPHREPIKRAARSWGGKDVNAMGSTLIGQIAVTPNIPAVSSISSFDSSSIEMIPLFSSVK